jgi:hypothetical protein
MVGRNRSERAEILALARHSERSDAERNEVEESRGCTLGFLNGVPRLRLRSARDDALNTSCAETVDVSENYLTTAANCLAPGTSCH